MLRPPWTATIMLWTDTQTMADFLQVLKVIRYSSKLLLASALSNSDSELATRVKNFEASIGTSRWHLSQNC